MASKFSLEAILSLTDQLTGPYKNTTRKITGMNAGLSRSFNKLNAGINRGLKRIAQVGLVALGAGIAFSTREFIRLDDSITQAGAKFKDLDVTSNTYKDTLKELSTAARDVGKVTEFSAVDAAGALDKFAMAGFTSSQSMALLMGTTNLATAAGTDLTTAVDIATDSLGAFNLVTEDTVQLEKNLARVSDVMAKTTTTANTNLEEMFESVKAGAQAFTAAGQSIESFAALTGIMANSGIKGSMAGTNLRNVMLRLAKPTGEAADVLKQLGIQTQDSAGNFRDVIDIIGDFEKGLAGMGSAQRTAALTTVFGARAVTGMNILLAEGSDSLRSYRDDLIDSGGASKTMAEAMRQSLGNRLKVIKSGLTELGLQFIEAFEVQGRGAIDKLIIGIQNFDMKPIVDGVVKVFNFLEKWGPIIIDLAPKLLIFAGAIKAIAIAQVAWNLAMSLSPLGAFLLAISATVVGAAALAKEFDKVKKVRGAGLFDDLRAISTAEIRERELSEDPNLEKVEGFERRRLQEQIVQETRRVEESRQRMDLFFNLPEGASISDSPSGAPLTGVSLGTQ